MRKQILLADDSATVEQLVSLAFADEAVDVHCVSTLECARFFLQEKTPDLILIDSVLPDGEAEAFIRSLRLTRETSAIPVVLLASTSKSSCDEVPGVDAVLSKPFASIGLLVSTANELMRKPRAAEARPLAELSRQPLEEGERNDMILEIEDIVEVRSFDARATAREMLASLSPEVLEELANQVAAILLQRIAVGTEEQRQLALAGILKSKEDRQARNEPEPGGDIDEVGKNPDD